MNDYDRSANSEFEMLLGNLTSSLSYSMLVQPIVPCVSYSGGLEQPSVSYSGDSLLPSAGKCWLELSKFSYPVSLGIRCRTPDEMD